MRRGPCTTNTSDSARADPARLLLLLVEQKRLTADGNVDKGSCSGQQRGAKSSGEDRHGRMLAYDFWFADLVFAMLIHSFTKNTSLRLDLV